MDPPRNPCGKKREKSSISESGFLPFLLTSDFVEEILNPKNFEPSSHCLDIQIYSY